MTPAARDREPRARQVRSVVMRRAFKIVAWSAGVVVGLTAVAATAGYFYLTSDGFRDQVAGHASSLTGRKTKIASVSIDWGSTARVQLSGVEVANPDWSKQPHMLKAEQIDFELKLWPLLKGDLVLPSLVLRKPEVLVEVGGNEQLNWSMGETPVATGVVQAATPDNRFDAPMIGRLEISEGKITYRDPKRKLELDGTISTAQGSAGDQSKAELQLKGKLEGQPLALKFVGGSVLMLRDTTQPYPIDLDVTFGGTKLVAKGTVQDPFQWTGANVDLTMSGPSLSEIYPILGIPGPPTPPYRLTGKLGKDGGVWKFTQSKWRVGDSDLAGDVTVDQRKKPAFLTAKLVSNNLAFKDLAPLIGAPPGRTGPANARQQQAQQQLDATGDLFPNTPLNVEKLRAMNMDVTLDAKKVVAPDYLPVQALAFRVLVNSGVATVKPLTMALVGSGTIAGEMSIDARTDTPKVTANLKASDMELQMFFRNSQYFDTTQGKIQARVQPRGPRPLARPGDEPRRRPCRRRHDRRHGERADGESRRPAALRRADHLCDGRSPHPDQVRRRAARAAARQCRARPRAARHTEIDPASQRPALAAVAADEHRSEIRAEILRPARPARSRRRRRQAAPAAGQADPRLPDPDTGDRHGQGRALRGADTAIVQQLVRRPVAR